MKTKILNHTCIILLCTLLLAIISACQNTFTVEPINRKTPMFEYASVYEKRMRVLDASLKFVAEKTKTSIDQIKVLSTEIHTWGDLCLEIPTDDEICPEEQIDGYLIILSTINQIIEVHTDSLASIIRTRSVMSTINSPQDQTIQLLAKQLDIPTTEILVQSIEPVEWQDSCLELGSSSACLAQIVPGFRVVLEARGQIFEYHTNQDASIIYGGLVSESSAFIQETDSLSQYLTISMEKKYFNSTMIEQLLITSDMIMAISNNEGFEKNGLSLTESEKEQLNNWKESFRDSNFTIRDETGQWETSIHLYGTGQEELPDFGQEVLLNFVLGLFSRESSDIP
jgi:hypothetical protein